MDNAGIQSAITGSVWFHHFGSITQDQMKKEKGLLLSQALGDRNNYNSLGLHLFERISRRPKRKVVEASWRQS